MFLKSRIDSPQFQRTCEKLSLKKLEKLIDDLDKQVREHKNPFGAGFMGLMQKRAIAANTFRNMQQPWWKEPLE